jgi:DNA-binding transcriptional regulator YiaG
MASQTSTSALRRLRRQAAEEQDPEKLKAIAIQILRLLKLNKRQAQPSAQPWMQAIVALRKNLELTQAQLAAKLDCSGMAVSRWERGQQQPPNRCLLEMGKRAGKTNGWILWNLAGITIEDVRKMI